MRAHWGHVLIVVFGLTLANFGGGQAWGQTTAPPPVARPNPPKTTPEVQALLDAGLKEAAAARWQEALVFYEQAQTKARELGDKVGEANALRLTSGAYNTTSRPLEALKYLKRALPLFRAAGDKSGEGRTLSGMGVVFWKTGQTARAKDTNEQAILLLRASGDKGGEAKGLSNQAIVYDTMGLRADALEYLQKALVLVRAVGDKNSEAIALNNLADLYTNLGQYEKALNYGRQSQPLFHALGDKGGEGYALSTLGHLYIFMGQLDKALEFCQQAQPFLQASGDKAAQAYVLTDIGYIYTLTHQPEKALDALLRAVEMRGGGGDVGGQAYALNTVGFLYRTLNQSDNAMKYFNRALQIFRAINDRGGLATTLCNIAIVQSQQGQLKQADVSFRQGIGYFEAQRRGLSGLTDAKISFLEGRVANYALYLDLLIRQNRVADAFALVQQMKARALLDLLDSSKVDLLPRLTAVERQRLAALRANADKFNTQMIAEGVRNEIGSKKRFEALQSQLRLAERDLSAYTDTLYVRHPDLAQARSAHTLSVKETARLLPPDTALLEYAARRPAVGKDQSERIVLFVVTSDGQVSVHDLPTTLSQLQSLAPAFRLACANPRQEYQTQARQLYDFLLAPAEKRLAGKKHLLICPDGPLWDVPFAALQDGKGRFVADTHLLSFAYSATGAQAALAPRRRAQPTGSVLALANPDFGDARRFGDNPHIPGQRPIDTPSRPIDTPSRPIDTPSRPIDTPSRPIGSPSRPIDTPSRDLSVQMRGGGIAALPGTQREADLLRRLYPDAALYTKRRAQESVFKQQAGKFKYLHLASHAFFNDAAPLLSAIFLAAPPATGPGSKDDGFLTARELFDMKLNASLVTLSACQTGRGETHSGEGVVGLTWALTVAGCPTQVVSQWSVDDAATATLMTGFYRQLKAGESKGEALQAASRAVRNEKAHRHPYYWAPFVLLGDWR